MADEIEQKGSFWTSMPGMITAMATLITAFTGAYLAFHKSSPIQTNLAPTQTSPAPAQTIVPARQPANIPAAVFQVRGARSNALNYQTHCPVTAMMRGTIEGVGKGIVAFRFVLSDGTATPFERRELSQPGGEVTALLQMNRNFRGTSQLETGAPNQLISNPSNFAVDCR